MHHTALKLNGSLVWFSQAYLFVVSSLGSYFNLLGEKKKESVSNAGEVDIA